MAELIKLEAPPDKLPPAGYIYVFLQEDAGLLKLRAMSADGEIHTMLIEEE